MAKCWRQNHDFKCSSGIIKKLVKISVYRARCVSDRLLTLNGLETNTTYVLNIGSNSKLSNVEVKCRHLWSYGFGKPETPQYNAEKILDEIEIPFNETCMVKEYALEIQNIFFSEFYIEGLRICKLCSLAQLTRSRLNGLRSLLSKQTL